MRKLPLLIVLGRDRAKHRRLREPVSSLQGLGRFLGEIYPTTHFLLIARGTFAKGLGFADLGAAYLPLLVAIPLLVALGVILLRKQER